MATPSEKFRIDCLKTKIIDMHGESCDYSFNLTLVSRALFQNHHSSKIQKLDSSSGAAAEVNCKENEGVEVEEGGRRVRHPSSRKILSASAPATVPTSTNLLGSFEESVLNGRLEPVSTVEGFTAGLHTQAISF